MTSSILTETNHNIITKEHFRLCWKDSPSIQHLLDVVSSILAEEYIAVAKQNPDVFLKNGGIK